MVRLDGDVCDRRLLSMQQDTARAQKQHRIRSRITISRCQSARVDVRQSEERQQRDAAVEEDGRYRVSWRGDGTGAGAATGHRHSGRNATFLREEKNRSKLGRVQVLRTETKRVFRTIYLSLMALTIQMKHNKRLQVLSDKTFT